MATPPEQQSWRDVREVGNAFGVRFLATVAGLFGRKAVRMVLYPIILYYALANKTARRTSREYLQRSTQAPRISWLRMYRHMLRFAQCTVDRYLFACGRTRGISVTVHGHHHLEELQREERGALLLGAHLGSFEAMRAASTLTKVRINIVADFRGSRTISTLLTKVGPELREKVIATGDRLATVLRIKECIDAGELVALLADRAEPMGRVLPVSFLGATALFPVGPYLLAATLGCPVFLTFGIHKAPNRYDVFCEPFAERIALPKRQRDPDLRALVQHYADRLEYYCRMAPDNWFNFFDFWSAPDPPA